MSTFVDGDARWSFNNFPETEFLCLGVCCYLAEIIAINLDTCSDNNSSDSDNNTSDSASTSQISTSEEIDYDSPEYKGPPKSLLKWYGYLSDEYKDKDRLTNAKTSNAILSKTFRVKIPPTMACAKDKKWKRKISKGS
nr:hypothetical protein [Tanacetum cinerariifolium]